MICPIARYQVNAAGHNRNSGQLQQSSHPGWLSLVCYFITGEGLGVLSLVTGTPGARLR